MDVINPRLEQALETLDRGVLLFALGGMIFNGVETSPAGILLTAAAAIIYGLVRNRITNLDHFEPGTTLPSLPGVNLARFMFVCQWLGSRHLFDGLLGDLVDPEIGGTRAAARQHLRETLWPAIWSRAWKTVLTRLWLERFV